MTKINKYVNKKKKINKYILRKIIVSFQYKNVITFLMTKFECLKCSLCETCVIRDRHRDLMNIVKHTSTFHEI